MYLSNEDIEYLDDCIDTFEEFAEQMTRFADAALEEEEGETEACCRAVVYHLGRFLDILRGAKREVSKEPILKIVKRKKQKNN